MGVVIRFSFLGTQASFNLDKQLFWTHYHDLTNILTPRDVWLTMYGSNKEKLTNYVLVVTPSFFPWQDKKVLVDNSTLSNCSPYYMLSNNLLGGGGGKGRANTYWREINDRGGWMESADPVWVPWWVSLEGAEWEKSTLRTVGYKRHETLEDCRKDLKSDLGGYKWDLF